ncbi:hypothetical protein RAHE111665_06165 [Rariglobus hedericola]
MSILGKLAGSSIVLLISVLSETTLLSDTVKVYDLSLSGQVHRSGFYGLAGEVSAPSSVDGYKVVAQGKLTLSEDVVVSVSVSPTGIFLLQLPPTQDRHWAVSLMEGDHVMAGPVSVEVSQPGVGLDWNLASKPSATNAPTDVERDAKLNRAVAKAIVEIAPSFASNIAAKNKRETPMPRPAHIKILEAGDPPQLEPKRLARDVDRLEDERLISLAEKLQTKEWSDRIVQKIGKPALTINLYGYNGAHFDEAIDLQVYWMEDKSRAFLSLRVAKLDSATLEADKNSRARFLLRDNSRAVPPARTERIAGYNAVYLTWISNCCVLAVWKDYHVTINLASADAALISQESLTGFLTLILEGI